jgi:hypothetical protein
LCDNVTGTQPGNKGGVMEEDTTPSEGNGTPTPEEHAAKIAEAKAFLTSDEVGLNVLGSEAFHGLKTDAAKPHIEANAALQKQYDSQAAELAKLTEWKTKLDNEGKSESELMAQRQIAWEKTNTKNQAALKVAEKERDTARAQLAQERVENRLVGLLTGSNDAEMSLLWARKEIGEFLSTDESGQLVWTQPDGIKIEGKAAGLKVSEWWAMDRQKYLQSGNVPGPPTAGSATAPTPPGPAVYKQLDPRKHSAAERIEHAKKWQREQGAGIIKP